MGGVRPSECRRGITCWSCSLVLLALGSVLSTSPASAQDAQPAGVAIESTLCRVYAVEGATRGVQDLRASCRGQGVVLGPATSFEAIDNEALGATLVDIHRGDERRVLMLSVQPDGVPLVEDLTGQVALAAGRGPMSAIDGVELEFESFSQTGEIGVRGEARDTGSARTDTISLGQQVALERERRGEAAQH